MNTKKQLHQIKVNLPETEESYNKGNGEGCWAEIDDKTFQDWETDREGGQYVGRLLNTPFFDFHGLQYGDLFVFEMRGDKRPVATMYQDTEVIINWLKNV